MTFTVGRETKYTEGQPVLVRPDGVYIACSPYHGRDPCGYFLALPLGAPYLTNRGYRAQKYGGVCPHCGNETIRCQYSRDAEFMAGGGI